MAKSRGAKMQLEKANPKMGFWRAKQGLSKHGFQKTKIGLILGKEEKREEEEEEEKNKRKVIKQAKVWNFGFLVWKQTLIMDSMRFCMYLWICMIIILSLNLGF